MKLAVRFLRGDQASLEVDPAAEVSEVKRRIEALRPDLGQAAAIQLIFSGRVLEDGQTLEAYSVTEAGFVVAMATKPKPAAVSGAPAVEAAPAPPAPLEPEDAEVPEPSTEDPVAALCAMGFPRDAVEHCLRAALNDPDRAVEYLTTGVPAAFGAEAIGAPAVVPSSLHGRAPFPAMPQADQGAAQEPPERSSEEAAALEQLRSHPQFREIASRISQHPELLGEILPMLAQENPELFQLIDGNREAVAELVAENGVETGFRLTPAELEAVGRLQELGFSRAAVVEAYVACDKNEEIAASFLFENAGDD